MVLNQHSPMADQAAHFLVSLKRPEQRQLDQQRKVCHMLLCVWGAANFSRLINCHRQPCIHMFAVNAHSCSLCTAMYALHCMGLPCACGDCAQLLLSVCAVTPMHSDYKAACFDRISAECHATLISHYMQTHFYVLGANFDAVQAFATKPGHISSHTCLCSADDASAAAQDSGVHGGAGAAGWLPSAPPSACQSAPPPQKAAWPLDWSSLPLGRHAPPPCHPSDAAGLERCSRATQS